MLLCSVFIYSTVAGRECEINLTVIVIVMMCCTLHSVWETTVVKRVGLHAT